MKFINKALTSNDLMNWCRYLGISITGIYSRNEHMPGKHSPCIINLDDLKGRGTHWVCCVPGDDKRTLWYFDSFGIWYPEEFKSTAKRDCINNIIFNNAQYQDINSVLCGYYVLFFLRERQLFNKGYFDILKPLSITNVDYNEKFIKNYFKNV